MKGTNLGEFEEMVLLVVINLQDDAYGLAIKNYISTECQRKVSISTVHATLHRLEEKGYLRSQYGRDHEERRGGRPKLLFTVTQAGEATLRNMRDMRNKLWNTAPSLAYNSPNS